MFYLRQKNFQTILLNLKVVQNSEVLPGIELGNTGAQGRDASLYALEEGSSASLNMRG